MGVDTKAIIRKGVTITEIVDVLAAKYEGVEVFGTLDVNYMRVRFLDGNDKRLLSVFFSDTAKIDHSIDGVLISLSAHGCAPELIKHLTETFGGYFCESDSGDTIFEPIRLDLFEQGSQFTPLCEFKNKVIAMLGYKNLNAALHLFDEYKTLIP
jgi:hypothetical protein